MKFRLLLLFLIFGQTLLAQKINVACVGNSVTYGATIADREKNCYPAQLQHLLGDQYNVQNFGKSGATLLYKGHRPYVQQEEFKAAKAFAADYVIIHLGLNDTDPRNWPDYGDEFIRDYLSLIDSFRVANPECKIWICRLTPIFNSHPRFKSGTRDWFWQIQSSIEKVADVAQVQLIDLHEALYSRPELFPDAIHPSAEGAAIIAKTVYSALTGDYGGLQLSPLFSDNMVLQHNTPLKLSGIANAGDVVTVLIGHQKVKTTTNNSGKWTVELKPLETGKSYTFTVSTPRKEFVYKNVLAGEVWLCSGQSNMAFMVKEDVDKKEQSEKAIDRPYIRFFDMKPYEMADTSLLTLEAINGLHYFKSCEWKECNEETASDFSAIAYQFGLTLNDSLKVPVGLILNAIGGSPCEAWIDRKTLEFFFPDILYNWTENDFIQDWVRKTAIKHIKQSDNQLRRHPYEPCYLFETGIKPLMQYPIKGVIWYQGESNAHNIEAHEQLFPLLVRSWRTNWGDDFPFYYVQLSGINRPSWPKFRDSQRRLLKRIPNTGMAVSFDYGDSVDVHPKHKKAIGERLARLALNKTYKKQHVVPSGPLFKSVAFDKEKAIVSFEYADELQTSDGKDLREFEVAETDGLYFPAKAKIIDNKVILESKQVKNPHFVRYAWRPFSRSNLVNGEGLPASTFKSR